ncbi:hypothetical protein [Burkholderia vietnamiensis]|uniref:hypothetical protein n=1 Tax=Burkholderia vietnamiensis TaxID=60552 RepID=UPI001B9ACFB7|nr:hypothetical protein [Burkholderia vietnamiensis]MBR8217730.1 hypothetical protein [Burkholderia vietnamiensis]MCA8229010.1 hypothetical protein [Burkholderia vietnamiensis]
MSYFFERSGESTALIYQKFHGIPEKDAATSRTPNSLVRQLHMPHNLTVLVRFNPLAAANGTFS